LSRAQRAPRQGAVASADLTVFPQTVTHPRGGRNGSSDGTPRAWCSTRAINRLLSETSVSSRDRLRTALEHREPDRIPLDFGSTAVTGVHVSCVAALRRYYGLSPGPVKVHEPYQMLGMVADDLRAAMGLDVTGVFPRKTMFGTSATDWKEWNFRGLDVLVPTDFRIRTEPNGDILIYPEGDETAAPSGRMPMGSAFFDTIGAGRARCIGGRADLRDVEGGRDVLDGDRRGIRGPHRVGATGAQRQDDGARRDPGKGRIGRDGNRCRG